MKAFKTSIQAAVIGLSALAVVGCGSGGSSNSQGTSFTLYSFYSDVECDTGLVGVIGPLSLDTEANGNGTGPIAYAGLQNNLLSQGIRVRRVFYKFFVEGATIQPPPTTAPAGIVLGSAGSNGNGSLPDNFGGASSAGGSSLGCMGFQIVPTDILSYVSLNRSNFPDLPFTMRVEVTVRGITTSGAEIDTNPLDFFVQFTEDNIITPPSGDDGSETAGTSEATDTGLEGDETEIPVDAGTGSEQL